MLFALVMFGIGAVAGGGVVAALTIVYGWRREASELATCKVCGKWLPGGMHYSWMHPPRDLVRWRPGGTKE